MSDNYTELTIDLDESDMECLRHGSGITFEFDGEDDYTLAVTVGREDKELDREWLLGEKEPDTGITGAEWRSVAGIAAVLLGGFQAAGPLINVFPLFTRGIIAVIGGMYIVSQLRRPNPSV